MKYVEQQADFEYCHSALDFLRSCAYIVAGIFNSGLPKKDMETAINEFSKSWNSNIDWLETESKKKELPITKSWYFAIRKHGVEAGESIEYVKQRCAILGQPMTLIKFEYKSRHQIHLRIRFCGVGNAEMDFKPTKKRMEFV